MFQNVERVDLCTVCDIYVLQTLLGNALHNESPYLQICWINKCLSWKFWIEFRNADNQTTVGFHDYLKLIWTSIAF